MIEYTTLFYVYLAYISIACLFHVAAQWTRGAFRGIDATGIVAMPIAFALTFVTLFLFVPFGVFLEIIRVDKEKRRAGE